MRSLIEFFLKRHLLVRVLLIAIFFWAIFSLLTTKRSAYPEVDLAQLIITTQYPGASPRDVEVNVTRKIEENLKGLPGVERFSSVSAENFSQILVEVDVDYPDQKEVIDEVRRAVDRVNDLPEEVEKKPEVRHIVSSEVPVMVVGVYGDANYAVLQEVAKVMERDLRSLNDIADVEKFGYRDKEFQVDLDPNALKKYLLGIQDIVGVLQNRNVRAAGGALESFKTERNIVTISELEDIDKVREVIVRSAFGGGALKLKDIASVQEGFEDEEIKTFFHGKEGIALRVKKTSTADILKVVDRLKEYVELKRANLPDGVELAIVNDYSVLVRNRLSTVMLNGLFGFILVILVLIFFLDLRSSFWIAMSIPTAFGIALILLPYFGMDLNTFTLAAMVLVLGMLVDDSIVVSENIIRHRESKGAFQAALDGTMEVVRPVSATILTSLCAFAPMLAMEGVLGRFVMVIPTTVIAALFGSFLDCFLILPNHLYRSSQNIQMRSVSHWREAVFAPVLRFYQNSLGKVLRLRFVLIPGMVILLVFSLWWGKEKMHFELFPADGAQHFMILFKLEEGKTFEASEEVLRKLEEYARTIPSEDLEALYAKLGTQEWDPWRMPGGGEENVGYLEVSLVPFSKRNTKIETVVEELREQMKGIEGVEELRFEIDKESLPVGAPITFHVHSDRQEHRAHFVDQIVKDLEKMEGIYGVTTSSKKGQEELNLRINYSKAAAAGVDIQTLANTLRVAFDGVKATSVVKNNEEIDIRVRFAEEHRQGMEHVLNLLVKNHNGKLVPLWAIAELIISPQESEVHHVDGHVTTTVYGQVEGDRVNPRKVVQALLDKYQPQLKQFPDVSFSYGGEAEKMDESLVSLLMAFVGGVLAIYLILVLLFKSFSQPLLILVAVPFGFIGVVWTFYFHGYPFSLVGLVGIVGLSGVVVNDSLVMVDFINRKLEEGTKNSKLAKTELFAIIQAGAKDRLRPVIITTLTTMGGLLPTAYGFGGADPLIAPMVLAVAYGLCFATLLTLYLLPCLYLVNQDIKGLFSRLFRRA